MKHRINMIKTKQIMQSLSWKHAVGEIALIVIGVSIALAASSWYEEHERGDSEIRVLQELRSSLQEDLANLRIWRDEVKRYQRGLKLLADNLEPGKDCSATALEYIGAAASFRIIHINAGPYEALKSQGLDLISDETLRMQIVNFYDSEWPDLLTTIDIGYDFVTNQAIPYMLRNFDRPARGEWIPLDNGICGSDPFLRNLVIWRLGGYENFEVPDYESAIVSIEKALHGISSKLGEHQ